MADNGSGEGAPMTRQMTQSIFKTAAGASKAATRLPVGDDYDYCMSYRVFGDRMQAIAGRLLRLTSQISDQQTTFMGISKMAPIDAAMDVDDAFEPVVDVVDAMLERVDMCVDEARGMDSKQTPIKMTQDPAQHAAPANMRGVSLPRPQDKFTSKPDNSNQHFVPLPYRDSNTDTPREDDGSYPHPYQDQLLALQRSPCHAVSCKEQMYAAVPDTQLIIVNTVPVLEDLVKTLREQAEFAIDLEHHDLRTFQGITCLMQISTRTDDYIVDTITLREQVSLLAPVFADPSIVKVMHGADKDVQWLQRDFGIYIVNLFDTGQASRLLEFASFGLAHLLKYFCDLDIDKKHQLSDWRIRPLPADMIEYAQSDTHYLLYVYDRMRNLLVEKSSPNRNLAQLHRINSARVCMIKYHKELWTPTAYLRLYRRQNCNFGETQLAVFAAVYKWRDEVARREDESCRYVLPNYMIFNLAAEMPVEPMSLVALCRPTPPLVRSSAHDLCRIIRLAKADPSKWPTTVSTRPGNESAGALPSENAPSSATASPRVATPAPAASNPAGAVSKTGQGGSSSEIGIDLGKEFTFVHRKAKLNHDQPRWSSDVDQDNETDTSSLPPAFRFMCGMAVSGVITTEQEGRHEAQEIAKMIHGSMVDLGDIRPVVPSQAQEMEDETDQRDGLQEKVGEAGGDKPPASAPRADEDGMAVGGGVNGAQGSASGGAASVEAGSGGGGGLDPTAVAADDQDGSRVVVVSEMGGKRKRRRRSRKSAAAKAAASRSDGTRPSGSVNSTTTAPSSVAPGATKFDFSADCELPELPSEHYEPPHPDDKPGAASDGGSSGPNKRAKSKPERQPLQVPLPRGAHVQRAMFSKKD